MIQNFGWQTALMVGVLLAVASSVPLQAQQPLASVPSQSALSVSPAILENVIIPGTPTPFTVEVRNITNVPLPIKTFVRGLTPEGHTSDLAADEQARLDASQWFTIQEPDFILQPNQTRTVTGVVQAPVGAEPGGHYATVFFQPLLPEEVLSPAMAYINARVGVLSFLIVQGTIKQEAALKGGIQTSKLVQHGPIIFDFTVHNSGNVHLMPAGVVRIYNVFGKQIAELPMPQGAILPDTSRTFTVEWDGPPTVGGYRAELALTYGAENTPLPVSTITFWVMPWVWILIGVIACIVCTFFVTKTRRRWGRAWRSVRGRKEFRL